MSRPATSRLKCNPPLGRMPVLQFVTPAELEVDPAYQRSIETGPSQTLIRKIAQFWNWDLCQPLVVSRRSSESGDRFFVIDGQHRLEAARLRTDIAQLPCVVGQFGSVEDEAASFVHLNQQRRPLSKLDLFKAALASDDPDAMAIVAAMTEAGLSLAPHGNFTSWKPGMVSNVAGIEKAWRTLGPAPTSLALKAMARGFEGQVLQYAGTIFPGVVAICAAEIEKVSIEQLVTMLAKRSQKDWRGLILQARAADPNLSYSRAAAQVLNQSWADREVPPPPRPQPAAREDYPVRTPALAPFEDGKRWCEQCEQRKTPEAVGFCTSRFCKLRKVAA